MFIDFIEPLIEVGRRTGGKIVRRRKTRGGERGNG